MTTRTQAWPAGMPCWTDLATTDVAQAQDFYRAVLGWSFQPPAEDYSGYVMAEMAGHTAAGIGPLAGEQQRPSWTLYLASDDADATAAAITEHGGIIILPAMDVGPQGRMLIATDPAGGVFGVWQAGQHLGASIVNEPGGIVWEDLRSTSPKQAIAFYGSVFGYEMHPLAGAGSDYVTFHQPGDEAPLGGWVGCSVPARECRRTGWSISASPTSTRRSRRPSAAAVRCWPRLSRRLSGRWRGWPTRPAPCSGSRRPCRTSPNPTGPGRPLRRPSSVIGPQSRRVARAQGSSSSSTHSWSRDTHEGLAMKGWRCTSRSVMPRATRSVAGTGSGRSEMSTRTRARTACREPS